MTVAATAKRRVPAKAAPPKPKSKLSVEYEEITPADAEEILEANTENNRNIKLAQVDKYARDMMAGRWEDNGETIKIDTNGKLIDGQHRMRAVLESGATMHFWVARGLPPETIHTVDVGVSRKYSDQLKISGHGNTMQLGAFLRRVFLWDRGLRTTKGTMSPSNVELDDYLANNEELISLAMSRAQDCAKYFKPLTPSVAAAAFFLCARKDMAMANEYFDKLIDPANIDSGHPVMRLRSRLYNTQRKLSPDEKLALTCRAWNHFRAGESVETIVVAAKGQLNDNNFPEPK